MAAAVPRFAARRLTYSSPTRRSSDLFHGSPHAPQKVHRVAPGAAAVGERALGQPVHELADQRVGTLLHRLGLARDDELDRKSTRLNSSHLVISYAVFCVKEKQQTKLM